MRVKRVAVLVVAGAVAFGVGFGGSEISKAMQPDDGKAAVGASAVQTAKPGGEDPVVDAQAKPSYVDAGRIVAPVIRKDGQSSGLGKGVAVREELGGRQIIKKKK